MFHHNKRFVSLAILTASTLGLISCTPSFETTAEKCATYSPVILATEQTLDNSEFKVLSNRTNNDYKLYLEDAFNSLKDIQSKDINGLLSTVSSDQQEAIQFILDKANEKMGYTIENGTVTSANNPLDYVESLLAATDIDEIIETFVDAKRNLAQSISKADNVCNYNNSAINLIIEDPSIPEDENNIVKTVNTQLSLNYNPYSKGENKDIVDQIILISLYDEPIVDLDIAKRKAKSFSGITRIASAEFAASGVSPSKIRQVNYSDSITNETFFFDDDFDELKLGQLVTTAFNTTCKDATTGEETTCTDPATIRVPQHDACKGGTDPITGTTLTDENNKYRENYFKVVEGYPSLEKVQRLRMEIDYPKNEIRLYASKYAEAILRADVEDPNNPTPSEIIYSPTNCEKQAVLDDLLAQYTEEEQQSSDFEGVRLTAIEDPNYDLISIIDSNGDPVLDSEGNETYSEPTPIFTFQGTAIPDRQ